MVAAMNISSIGVQLIQADTGMTQQPPAADAGSDRSSERETPSAPTQAPPAPGTGEVLDKTV